jgi:hypothetical protein
MCYGKYNIFWGRLQGNVGKGRRVNAGCFSFLYLLKLKNEA